MPQAAQQLTREKINDVRAKRRAAIRRRRILVVSLLVVAAATLVCAFVFHFTPLWALIPVVVVAIVLFFGSRAAKVARAWEDSVKTAPQNSRPGAGSPVAPSSKSGGGNGDSHDSLGASSDPEILESAPTYVIPVDDVREVLRKQAIEKAAAISRHHAAQHEHSAEVAQSVGAETGSSVVTAAKSDDSAAAVVLHSASVPSGSEKSVQAENSNRNKENNENGEKDLISFSLGADTSVTDASLKDASVKAAAVKDTEATNAGGKPVATKAQAVESAEITSYRQVAQAQPLSPSRQAEIFADVTPSDVSLDKVAVPAQSEDSLGVDIDAVIARRQS